MDLVFEVAFYHPEEVANWDEQISEDPFSWLTGVCL